MGNTAWLKAWKNILEELMAKAYMYNVVINLQN